jgi:ABC-type branched-subunit amino acid transport system ATPase component
VQVVDQVNAAFGTLRSHGTTLLLVEEKAHDAMVLADRVTALNLGRVHWEHDAADVDERKLTEAYLGSGDRSTSPIDERSVPL